MLGRLRETLPRVERLVYGRMAGDPDRREENA
uniref:Uncharacterized protein n=1 Tax=Myoviridae sp. ctngn1 TaxID=2823551 RepID=A0A8S5LCM4_9CAUD|nr:MAG TPA: hypothetical protein [Myoviridae sp. ctngn1]